MGFGLVVVGLLAGIVLGGLFTGTDADPGGPAGTVVDEPNAAPPSTAPLTTTTTEVAPVRLAEMVSGMLDTLVTSALDRTGMAVVTSWSPAARAPSIENLPWGNLVADASRGWLAFGGPNRWVTGQTLWVGNQAYMEPISSQLSGGYAWHTRLPGELAWIEATAEGRQLVVSRFLPGQIAIRRVVSELDDSIGLVGWTDTGYLTARYGPGDGVLELRDETGTVFRTLDIAAGPLAVGRDLMSIVDPDGIPTLVDSNLTPVAPAPWGTDCSRVQWGPVGLGVAVLCGFGTEQRYEYWQNPLVETVPTFLHSGMLYADFGFVSNGIPYVVWGESLRPSSTILFYHTFEGAAFEVTYPGLVQWLETVDSFS